RATTHEDRILTVPNLDTFIRLAGVGVFWWLLFGAENVPGAAWLMVINAWPDWMDGWLARELDQVPGLGTALEPVDARLLIASAVIGGLIKGVVPVAIALPLLLREAVMALVAGWMAAKGHGVLEVRYLGKLATFILYGAAPAFYLAAAGVDFMWWVGWIMGVVGLALYWWVLFQYVADARQRQLESPRPERNGT